MTLYRDETVKAADWAQPHLKHIPSNHPKAVTTLMDFAKAFNEAFSDPDAACLAGQQIEALKQDSSVTNYTTSFETLRLDLKWNEPTLIPQYE